MSTPAETGPNLEILSVAEADAYIRAAHLILCNDLVDIPGLKSTYPVDLGGPPSDFRMTGVDTFDPRDPEYGRGRGVRFETIAFDGARGVETSIGQSVGNDRQHDRNVSRSFFPGSKEPEYYFLRPAGLEDEDVKVQVRAKTDAEREMAEVLFATMATDFKEQLEERLADRTDLLDAIEWQLKNPSDQSAEELKRKKTLGQRILGRLRS